MAAVAAGVFLWDQAYWFVIGRKARSIGFFRDDRRDNDLRYR